MSCANNGLVVVTTLWTDERVYYLLHVVPYSPASRLSGGKADPRFRTKPQIALSLIESAQAAQIRFHAVAADCFYGDNNELARALRQRQIPYVFAYRSAVSCGLGPSEKPHSFEEALQETPLKAWQRITRRFSKGHTKRWWAVESEFLYFGPRKRTHAICVTTDWRRRPDLTTWHLSTNLQRAVLEAIMALYATRKWVEQGYKQVKDELGRVDFQVR